MATPSPFEQRKPLDVSGVDSKSTIPGGAQPISGPGATPNLPDTAPVPAPAPVTAAPAPSPVTPFAQRAPAAPAPTAKPLPTTPAETPQMVPAYVAKAMQKQQEKQAKENEMVAVPAAVTPPAPAPPATPVAPAAPASTDTTRVTATTTEQPTSTAQADGYVPVVEPTVAEYAVTETDTPDQAQAKTTAAAVQTALMEQAKKWAEAKEDPAFVRQFNNLLLQSAVQNQATIDATKRAIAQNPSLAGQPAGDALLGLKAIQLGMNLDQMKANLSVDHAKAVADMNRYGFEAMYKLNQDKLSQDEKDVETYGQIFDRMISSGASDQELEAYFNKTIKPLMGDKDISYAQFRSPAERQRILSDVWTAGDEQFRDALDRDDLPAALQALEAAYAPAEQVRRGNDLIAKNDLATINGWLKDAGYDEITDMADLIGREDDVFVAQQVSKGKKKISESPVQPKVDALLKVLQGRGMDITDPDIIGAVEEYIYQQEFGDPEDPNVLPWDSDVTSYKYKDWEIFDPSTGRVVDAGGEMYDPQDNPEPAPGSAAYQWRDTLDKAWQNYLAANPDSKTRLSRDDWFAKLKKDYLAVGKPDIKIEDFISGNTGEGSAPWTPSTAGGTVTNPTSTADYFTNALASKDLSKITNDLWPVILAGGAGYENAYQQLVDAGLFAKQAAKPVNIKNYKTKPGTHNIQNYKAAYSDLKPGSFVEVDGNPYRIEEVGVTQSAGRQGIVGDFSRENRAYTKVTNLKTGQTEYILPSDKWEA